MYQELVEYIVESLVDDPSAVVVTVAEYSQSVEIEIRVAQGDAGRVIGKEGRIVNAIRDIVQVKAAQEDKRVSIEVL
jgi:uncharacterized protein